MMTQLIFSVENMKCGGCVTAIETALNTLDGVYDINVSLENKQATVTSTKSEEEIAKTITEAGFPASLL